MPNIKSAKKRVRTIENRTVRNSARRSALRTALKRFDAAAEAGDQEKLNSAFMVAVKKVDKAVVYGLIHKNKAARKKSQLQRRYDQAVNASNAS
ncbi:30S ribosomal protein S20 [Metallumcola ferriviriculae]|uniref:Small ribosomal subunit protein bS20 n=1 Tax=Metallumcola ferriviriculae TaxID=3039180 RepID=A0AAU0ULJ1_9FIRM|nr:30S ribosomal protein S20 [Desulfitibacteraceae bacterium MK1]